MADRANKELPLAEAKRSKGKAAPRPGLRLLEEIGRIISEARGVRSDVQSIVELIASSMSMEVCSVYIFNAEQKELTLWATAGLDPASIGQIRMDIGEGLTGIVVQKRQPVMAVDARAHPRYKYFPDSGEERFHSFLGMPVVEHGEVLGVLNVQTSRRRRFSAGEVSLFRALATPIAGILRQAQLRHDLVTKEEERRAYEGRLDDAFRRLAQYEPGSTAPSSGRTSTRQRIRLSGFAASPGFGIGRAHVLTPALSFDAAPRDRQQPARREIRRLSKAVEASVEELTATGERVRRTVPEIDTAIFEAQRMMLLDSTFQARIQERIEEGLSAEAALGDTVDEFSRQFSDLNDAYMRDRASDVRDIGQRVLHHLLGVGSEPLSILNDVVLVAEEVSLSDLATVEHHHLNGLVLASGGVTSHASILSKSLEIPTVVGVDKAMESIREGDFLIVDGNAGVIYVNPTAEVQREYQRLGREYRAFSRELRTLVELPAETLDGHKVKLCANVGLLGDVRLARLQGAESIGLYRTEVPFLSHRDFLTEEEQYDLYRRVVAEMEGRPVTVRTLDLGADKYPRYFNIPKEENPYLGWRSIRISLQMPDIFKVQLRAILRASAHGPVRIMFPMISSLEEIRQVKWLLAEARDEVAASGHAFDPAVQVGMMVEVPSAVYLASKLIAEVDFFSIGTNDLIQYILAVDRNNRKVGSLYEPLHPAVLLAIADVVAAARAAGKPVSLCGEMAADPTHSLVLIGLGLTELSMGSFFIPAIKRLLRAVRFSDIEKLAAEALTLASVNEVKSCVFETMRALGVIDIIEVYH
jgi:phosphotransferase system enzyme I (PtsP)